MAITEQDYLLLRDTNKARTWMMLKSEQQFHLVRVDASLTEQRYERLMKRYPCGLKTFQELGIAVTPLDREGCTHVILEGTGEGAKLTMYCTGNVRRYTLGDSYDEDRLASFFDSQQLQRRIVPKPPGPDARTTKALGWLLTAGGVGMLLSTILPIRFPALPSLLSFAAAVALCTLWPGRFAIGAMKNEDRSTEAKYRFDMELALIAPLMAMVLDALRVTYPDLLPLILWGVVVGLAIGTLLTWASREHRSILSGAVGLTFGLMVFSGGIIAQVNQLLDFSPTTAYALMVDKTEIDTGGRGRASYDCFVTMPDGKEVEFDIPRVRYEELKPGDPITVIAHEGSLGFEYLTIDWSD